MKYSDLLKEQIKSGKFSYDGVGENASPAIQKAIDEFRNLPENEKKNIPLLYHLLGSGTPPYKMRQTDVEYIDNSINKDTTCGNCEFAYQKNINKTFICSQIRGRIQLSGWCNQWKKGKE